MKYLAFIQQMHNALGAANLDPHSWEIRSLQAVGSTNTRVADMLGLYEKVIVLTEIQTQGRGRGNNVWYSPEGGLWLSFGILCDVEVEELSTPVIEEIQTILSEYISCEIKPPNDILIDGKKVCGVLVETKVKQQRLKQIIVGVGINIKNDIPDEVSDIATRLMDHTENVPDTHELAGRVVVKIMKRFRSLLPELGD